MRSPNGTGRELELTLRCGWPERKPVSAFDLAWSRSSPARDLWFRDYLGRAEPRHLCFQCGTLDRIRCKRATEARKRWGTLRKLVLERAGYRCEIRGPHCRRHANAVDHIWPWSQGGTDDPSNLRAACNPCNARKGKTLPVAVLPLFVSADGWRAPLATEFGVMVPAAGMVTATLGARDTNSGPPDSAAGPALAVAPAPSSHPTAEAPRSSDHSGLLIGGARNPAQGSCRTSEVESTALKGGGHVGGAAPR